MTILENRFMESIPSKLHEIAETLHGINFAHQMPIIEFETLEGEIITEIFESAKKDLTTRKPHFHINGYSVADTEYNRLITLIHKLPLFAM